MIFPRFLRATTGSFLGRPTVISVISEYASKLLVRRRPQWINRHCETRQPASRRRFAAELIEPANDSGPCPQPTYKSSDFLPHGADIEQVRDRKGQEASPQNGRHHVQANARRDRNRYK